MYDFLGIHTRQKDSEPSSSNSNLMHQITELLILRGSFHGRRALKNPSIHTPAGQLERKHPCMQAAKL
jgi:hypothetical protein